MEFKIEGVIEADVTIDEVNDAIVDLMEEKGWFFGGGLRPIQFDENGEEVE